MTLQEIFNPATISLIVLLLLLAAGMWALMRRTLKGESGSELSIQLEQQLNVTREQNVQLTRENARLQELYHQTSIELTRVETLLEASEAKVREAKANAEAEDKRLREAFQSMASKALESNNKVFLDLAESTLKRSHAQANQNLLEKQQSIQAMLQPVQSSLERVDRKIEDLEKSRVAAYEGLQTHLKSLVESQTQLRTETSNLVRALRSPSARGRWGELQLRRVVELSGMVEHCDFFEQVTSTTGDEMRRPDLIVKLPGGKNIVVDAKTPLISYLEAQESSDDKVRQTKFQEHAAHVRRHVQQLGQKSYWQQFQPSPEFVVLFLPGEPFFGAALEHDPTLIEAGVEHKVIIATPTTLIALLRAIAYGWRQESLAEHAQQIADIGRQLYQRLGDFGSHMSDLSKHLGLSVRTFNKMVGSYDRRVLVSARKLNDLKVESEELPEAKSIEFEPRMITDEPPARDVDF